MRILALLSAVVFSATLIVACGKATDPDPVSVAELKYPGALKITDMGNGTAKLTWMGSNNESDFDGYSVYGMKEATAGALGVTAGKALELIDDKGVAIEASKTIINNFNYDPAAGKLETKGTKTDPDAKFEALPIHANDADATTPMLPTCKPQTDGTCKATAKADVGTKGDTIDLNGATSYTVTGLKPGSKYCFFVLSSMDEGKKVSQTSSNVECIVPKFEQPVTFTGPSAKAEFKQIDLFAYGTTTCTAAACATPPTVADSALADYAGPTAAMALYIEKIGTNVAFVTGKNSAIVDLGYYALGFADPTLPAKRPLTLDNENLQRKIGYAPSGQSILVLEKHMYVIAVGDAAATTLPTQFRYHYIYVTSAVAQSAAVNVTMRLSAVPE